MIIIIIIIGNRRPSCYFSISFFIIISVFRFWRKTHLFFLLCLSVIIIMVFHFQRKTLLLFLWVFFPFYYGLQSSVEGPSVILLFPFHFNYFLLFTISVQNISQRQVVRFSTNFQNRSIIIWSLYIVFDFVKYLSGLNLSAILLIFLNIHSSPQKRVQKQSWISQT